MRVAVVPDERAARNPHGLALADGHNGELTSAHLLQRVQVAAEHLANAGVGAGQSLRDTHRSRSAQRLVGARSKLTEDRGRQLSAEASERLRGAADAAESPGAFAEKQPAIWKGR